VDCPFVISNDRWVLGIFEKVSGRESISGLQSIHLPIS
jgi:hypothetical protein